MSEQSTPLGATPVRGTPVRVALSMLTLVPGGMGGSETYARELVRGLARSERVDATGVVARVGAGFCDGIPEVVVPRVHGGPSTAARIRTLAEAGLAGPSVRRTMSRFDVVHVPFTAPVPRPPRDVPLVQTLHDTQHLELPHLFSRAELAYRRHYYEGAARTAAAVVTVSAFAGRQIVERLGVAPERVHVAHLGVDVDAFTPHLGEREPFLYYPARGWAHKNHARLFEAVALVRRERPDLRLVLTGGGLEGLRDVPDFVDVRGLVPFEEVRRLYRTASALVFPSLYEGFGLPPLEAMASGCPVAASSAGSLPEVCGDAAVLFDPQEPEDVARATLEALARATELQARGLEQVRRFTWAACTRAHEDAYAAAVADGGA